MGLIDDEESEGGGAELAASMLGFELSTEEEREVDFAIGTSSRIV